MYFLITFAVAIVILLGIWIFVPILYGVPWRPTAEGRIRQALALADLKPDEIIYDLGAGDGRVLILAAREFGARGVGIEIGPVQVMLTRLMAVLNGVSSQVRVRRGDFRQADLHEADVVFAYLTSDQALRLQKQLEAQLRNGARVVTISFDFPGWQPEAFERNDLIFLYRMPPPKGDLISFLERQE